ncbi:MAG: 2-C-methyl-D-erythritol 2,4-cyclodiphosphate synthase [Chitinophagaceae bacterium]
MYKIGSGIDFHQLIEKRPFILGGIEIPYHKGLLGHSDADVLLHAIVDALLGALSIGDIGTHFPDNDMQYKNADSKLLLQQCYQLITHKGYEVVNIDATVCLQKPKIMPFIAEMKTAIGKILNIPVENISIKATTTEKMGFVGREEGIMAIANTLLQIKSLPIKIINTTTFPLPLYASAGASGMDLRAYIQQDLPLAPMQRILIPTGLFMEIPLGYEAQIRSRSGLAINEGIICLNSPGTIDADYRGEIKIILMNTSEKNFTIHPGDKIAQIIVQKIEHVQWFPTTQINNTERQKKGFGHTGLQ